MNNFNKLTYFTLPFIPSPRGRGNKKIPSPLAGKGEGEGDVNLFFAFTIESHTSGFSALPLDSMSKNI
jgi:hypothetical protein